MVLLARKEPDHRAPLFGDPVADRAKKSRMRRLEGVQDRALGDGLLDAQLDGPPHPRQDLQVPRQDDLDHFSVWTSTDRTPGRSRTIAFHESPPSGDAYTWPPLVPK